ncbi:MAG TPA: DUF6596 domain-containing protein, partial [Terrimicrobiaceae bacterium]|nr:DUF6596 domain-containing protein [Terrimicrobiaceae bacterium]
RETRFRKKQEEIAGFLDHSEESGSPVLQDEIEDDRLRMIFVCCHTEIPQEDQVALALRTLCGFSVAEIAHAFLTTEAAIAKRLTRAKQRIRTAQIAFEIPDGPELTARLNGVLQTLYLLFNEGYKASGGERLIREELCHEAIRLTNLVAGHVAGNRPQTHALLALMLLNAARLRARTDAEGQILRLKEQNRSRWDKSMIARGMFHLAKSAQGTEVSVYHLQAGIAACHCAAPDDKTTDWPQILSLYDRLVELDASPIVALNRAVAVANVHGPAAGLSALKPLRDRKELKSYYLLYAILAEFEAQLGHRDVAAGYFRRALRQTAIASEQHLLRKRLRECERELTPELATR